MRNYAVSRAIPWMLPVAGFVGFTTWDALRSRWAHRDEPPNVYNQSPRYRNPWWR